MDYEEIINRLNSLSDPKRIEHMKKYGIKGKKILGIQIPALRELGKQIGINHKLAQDLWSSGIHEAKLLASLIDDPNLVTEEQMEKWVNDFESWDITDGVVGNLFDRTKFAYKKALEWRTNEYEYIKRAAFVLMLRFTIGKKKMAEEEVLKFLPMIENGALDEREMVKKGVNWALRQIGKTTLFLNKEAIKTAEKIYKINTKTAKWIATDALRELKSEKIQNRLLLRAKKVKKK